MIKGKRIRHILKKKHKLLHRKLILGFTLIEMLVVSSLVVVLVGVTASQLDIDHNFKNAHDSARKQDLNTIHKALVQYFVENRCLPTTEQWDALTCNGPVPDYLAPYFSKIPCDPETQEKYYYEPLDNSCNRCNGGCGVCMGLRLLTHLEVQKDKSGKEVGCNPDSGCGKFDSKHREYNYGISFGNSCLIPTPTIGVSPTIIPSISGGPTGGTGQIGGPTGGTGQIGGPTGPTGITPIIQPTLNTTPTITPIPNPTAIPLDFSSTNPNIGKSCPNNILTNGSFETDSNNDKLPDGWDPEDSWLTRRTNEGIVCDTASNGACSFRLLPWISPIWSPTKMIFLRKTLNISGPAGTSFTYSADVKSTLRTTGSGDIWTGVNIYYTDGTRTTDSLTYSAPVNNFWLYGIKTVYATKPFNKVIIQASTGPNDQIFTVDNYCVTENTAPIPTPTPLKNECIGQLLPNGSFEQASDTGPQYPAFWDVTASGYIFRLFSGEGRDCSQSIDGTCSWHIFPLYYPPYFPTGPSHQTVLRQSLPLTGNTGDTIILSLDAKLQAPIFSLPIADHGNTDAVEMIMYPQDSTKPIQKYDFPLSKWTTTSWMRSSFSIKAANPYRAVNVTIGQPFQDQYMYIDKVCLVKQ